MIGIEVQHQADPLQPIEVQHQADQLLRFCGSLTSNLSCANQYFCDVIANAL